MRRSSTSRVRNAIFITNSPYKLAICQDRHGTHVGKTKKGDGVSHSDHTVCVCPFTRARATGPPATAEGTPTRGRARQRARTRNTRYATRAGREGATKAVCQRGASLPLHGLPLPAASSPARHQITTAYSMRRQNVQNSQIHDPPPVKGLSFWPE